MDKEQSTKTKNQKSELTIISNLFQNRSNLAPRLFARVRKRRTHVSSDKPKHIKRSLQSANAIAHEYAPSQHGQPLLQRARTLMLPGLKRIVDSNGQLRSNAPDG